MNRTVVGALGESLGDYLREQRRTARLSLRQLAELADVSNPYLSQVERGLRRPSAQVLGQIARGLQISSSALLVRAGLLDHDAPQAPGSGVPEPWMTPTGPTRVAVAVADDPHLDERQKQVLLDVYESFRRSVPPTPSADRPAGPTTDMTTDSGGTP